MQAPHTAHTTPETEVSKRHEDPPRMITILLATAELLFDRSNPHIYFDRAAFPSSSSSSSSSLVLPRFQIDVSRSHVVDFHAKLQHCFHGMINMGYCAYVWSDRDMRHFVGHISTSVHPAGTQLRDLLLMPDGVDHLYVFVDLMERRPLSVSRLVFVNKIKRTSGIGFHYDFVPLGPVLLTDMEPLNPLECDYSTIQNASMITAENLRELRCPKNLIVECAKKRGIRVRGDDTLLVSNQCRAIPTSSASTPDKSLPFYHKESLLRKKPVVIPNGAVIVCIDRAFGDNEADTISQCVTAEQHT